MDNDDDVVSVDGSKMGDHCTPSKGVEKANFAPRRTIAQNGMAVAAMSARARRRMATVAHLAISNGCACAPSTKNASLAADNCGRRQRGE
ncbi:hypothetical protein M514_17582 [Trichuris suis]|uniref:Uncharacterized protein n=1 Tax=Trichuris suis TaxID=68888 RepID=A0A085NL86_9BILA|nr:hypothetical protein M514_17582 [Trichuris suis]